MMNADLNPIERIERKFVTRQNHHAAALAWLRHLTAPEEPFPSSRVHTVYYDTPALDAYEESIEGDVVKQKVRARWYDGKGPVYLEMKSKDGLAATKFRRVVDVPAGGLGHGAPAEVVSREVLDRALPVWGYHRRARPAPVLYITYLRHRFTEPESGLRINLDTNIASSYLTGNRLTRPQVFLPLTVVEMKGASVRYSRRLSPLKKYLSDWTAFSKYGACMDLHLSRTAPWSSNPSSFWAGDPGLEVRS